MKKQFYIITGADMTPETLHNITGADRDTVRQYSNTFFTCPAAGVVYTVRGLLAEYIDYAVNDDFIEAVDFADFIMIMTDMGGDLREAHSVREVLYMMDYDSDPDDVSGLYVPHDEAIRASYPAEVRS